MRNTIHIVLYEKDLVSFDDIDENLKFTLEIIEEIKKVLQ